MNDDELDGLIARARARDSTLTSKDVNALTRACLCASPGNVFIVSDFAGIEARVLAWASGDVEALAVFTEPGGDPYKRLASRLYGVPESEITKQQRQLGKIAELAAGFGMGPDKLEATGVKTGVDWAASGLDPADVVRGYREAHQPIVQAWRDAQAAAVAACDGYTTTVGPYTFGPSPLRAGDVWAMLPSGRPIVYFNMRYTRTGRGADLVFDGRRGPDRTYGGKLVENLTQAVARDLLATALVRAEAEGLCPVFHVHDEIVLDVPAELAPEAERRLCEIMGDAPAWAEGLPLRAESFACARYRK